MDVNEKEPSVSGVAAVDRALAVLTVFRRGDAALSLAELARRTGLVKTTVMRLALSLEKAGLLFKGADGGYRLGSEALRLGSIYQDQFNLGDAVVPVLRALADATLETASFYVRRDAQRLCLFRAESPQTLRLHVRPGDLLPMDESSVAQTLRLGEAGPQAVPHPIYTAGRRDPHVASLAAAVFGPDATLMGALSIAGPISRFDSARAEAVSGTLAAAARDLTRLLGGEGGRG